MACINNSNNSGRSAGRITAISLIPQRSAEGLSLRMLQGCHPSAAAAAMGLSSNTDRLADIQDIITEVLDLIGQDDSAIGSAATPIPPAAASSPQRGAAEAMPLTHRANSCAVLNMGTGSRRWAVFLGK
eukprot:CAMPEP_0119545894 /NCGR_PEP_ID=MMETSP1352-20130426/513_1 /TAXON_ID=265584 /ORGANISM="Stauroneis constricta, Strain CCMP1120" /LENGTH=128 /DNA_ID=CAMNT_0007590513 /DNA_START=86 /DNA_END=473 /DNA_ORIENTATION=+